VRVGVAKVHLRGVAHLEGPAQGTGRAMVQGRGSLSMLNSASAGMQQSVMVS
jgi:hypothetical protein